MMCFRFGGVGVSDGMEGIRRRIVEEENRGVAILATLRVPYFVQLPSSLSRAAR